MTNNHAYFFHYMKVTITIVDRDVLSKAEAEAGVRRLYGDSALIEVTPENDSAEAYIKFGIQNMITKKHAELFYEEGNCSYPLELSSLREEVMSDLEYILNSVIIDNEERFA